MGYKVFDILNCSKEKCQELYFIREKIEKFVKEMCESYLDECRQENERKTLEKMTAVKSFYDSVWGSIEVEERDIYLIDCPLIQRLRDIKQLGMVNYLYSTANHTRFSHTLGVMKIAGDLVEKVMKECSTKSTLKSHYEGDDIFRCVRIAALFHDVGHMFFSHASERYFGEYRDSSLCEKFQKVQSAIRKEISKTIGIAEILSLLILNTNIIRELLTLTGVLPKNSSTDDIKKELDKIFCFIIGFPHSSKYVPFSQILSGPLDSDKLDYLKRDSYETGVPIAVDMSRIFQKIRVVQSKKKSMSLSEDYKLNQDETRFEMGISLAAVNTVDQFVISRYMMFENVYHHQKVLTAETYLREGVYELDRSSSGLFDNIDQVMLLTDDKLLNTEYISSLVEKKIITIKDINRFNRGLKILNNIKLRKLPKRVLSVSGNEGFIYLGDDNSIIDNLFKNKVFKIQREFIDLMTEEMKTIAESLDRTCTEHFDVFFVSSPNVGFNELNSNLAIDKQDVIERNEIFESDNWIKSRGSQKTQNYIVSNPHYRSIALIAFEKILFEKYKVVINTENIIQFNDKTEVEKFKKTLVEKGYYKDSSRILVEPDILFRYKDKAIELETKWGSFNRRCDINNKDERITASSILKFVHQFYCFEPQLQEFDRFVEECFDLLSDVKLVSYNVLVESLKKIIGDIINENSCDSEDINVFPIGGMQDSSYQLIYRLNTVNSECNYKVKVQAIENIRPDEIREYVVFLDDAFFSGSQLKDIISTWANSSHSSRENHSIALKPEVINELKTKKIYFAFVYANDESVEPIVHSFKESLNFSPKIISFEKFDNKDIEDKYPIAKKYFKKVGEKLIEIKSKSKNGEYKEHWPEERRMTSHLGYNDAQQLIVFPWNTPTYSLTALWLSAEDTDFKWFSLFTRQDKKKQ